MAVLKKTLLSSLDWFLDMKNQINIQTLLFLNHGFPSHSLQSLEIILLLGNSFQYIPGVMTPSFLYLYIYNVDYSQADQMKAGVIP